MVSKQERGLRAEACINCARNIDVLCIINVYVLLLKAINIKHFRLFFLKEQTKQSALYKNNQLSRNNRK